MDSSTEEVCLGKVCVTTGSRSPDVKSFQDQVLYSYSCKELLIPEFNIQFLTFYIPAPLMPLEQNLIKFFSSMHSDEEHDCHMWGGCLSQKVEKPQLKNPSLPCKVSDELTLLCRFLRWL